MNLFIKLVISQWYLHCPTFLFSSIWNLIFHKADLSGDEFRIKLKDFASLSSKNHFFWRFDKQDRLFHFDICFWLLFRYRQLYHILRIVWLVLKLYFFIHFHLLYPLSPIILRFILVDVLVRPNTYCQNYITSIISSVITFQCFVSLQLKFSVCCSRTVYSVNED